MLAGLEGYDWSMIAANSVLLALLVWGIRSADSDGPRPAP